MELSQTWHKRGDFPIDSAERHSIQQTVTNGRIVHEEDIFLAQKGVGIMRDDITISSALEESERCTSEIERQVLSDASHCTDLVRLAVGKLLRLHITISLRLKEWKMAQNKMIYDYSVIQAELSVIEVYISSLMGIALRLAQVCHHLGEAALLDSTKELIESVVSTSMVLEQQPPRVLKTNSRLAPKLRYLLSQHATKITPARAIVLTADGVSLLKAGKRVQDCALLEKDVITMSFDGKSWTGDGQGMKLKKFRRVKGGLKVTEQLYYLAFVCDIRLSCTNFTNICVSSPIVIIVHGNQAASAWATIMWTLVSDSSVCMWGNVAEMLSLYHQRVMQQPLLDAHIQYFKRVIVGEEGEGGAPIVSSALTEPRSKRGFSFWSWFCASIELKKKFLPEQQEVVRFMSRDDVKRLLRNDVPGTFILRFSESCLGAVTVAFVDDSGRVVHLQPWNGSDLKARSIADRIKDLSVLQFVVCRERRRHKDEIFGEFYSAVEASSMDDVYVTTQMVLAMCRSQQHKEEVEGEYCEAVEEEDDLEDIIEMMDQAVDEIGTHFYPKRSSMEDFETWLARGVCVGDVGEEEEEWVRSMGLCM